MGSGATGSRRDEVSTNVSQHRPCLDGKLLLADALLFYNQRLLLGERWWGEEQEEEGREPRNLGRMPEGKKGLANAIIIICIIAAATAASAKNRLERARRTEGSREWREVRRQEGMDQRYIYLCCLPGVFSAVSLFLLCKHAYIRYR